MSGAEDCQSIRPQPTVLLGGMSDPLIPFPLGNLAHTWSEGKASSAVHVHRAGTSAPAGHSYCEPFRNLPATAPPILGWLQVDWGRGGLLTGKTPGAGGGGLSQACPTPGCIAFTETPLLSHLWPVSLLPIMVKLLHEASRGFSSHSVLCPVTQKLLGQPWEQPHTIPPT